MSVRVLRVDLGSRARREERRVASHTSDEQRRNALQSGPQHPHTHTKTALLCPALACVRVGRIIAFRVVPNL